MYRLTKIEERNFTNWLLTALRERPDDFTADNHYLTDKVTGIQILIGSGRSFIQVSSPVYTEYFRWRNSWPIWAATYNHRMNARDQMATTLFRATLALVTETKNIDTR